MPTKTSQPVALGEAFPKDQDAAEKLDALMRNLGLSAAVLGAETGVSGKWIREQIIGNHRQPGPRIRHALARRFGLLPADIWRCDRIGLSPQDLDHLRLVAERSEQAVA